VWSGLPADDKPESAVADMQGRQPPKSTTTMPDAQLTPGRADNSKTQSGDFIVNTWNVYMMNMMRHW